MNEPTHVAMDNFERGFSSRTSGARRTCKCGRTFYNPNGGWDWDEGELDALEADKAATWLEWAAGSIILEGVEYAMDCDCWRERAVKVIRWILDHDDSIAEFLSLERERKTREANRSPVVRPAAETRKEPANGQ